MPFTLIELNKNKSLLKLQKLPTTYTRESLVATPIVLLASKPSLSWWATLLGSKRGVVSLICCKHRIEKKKEKNYKIVLHRIRKKIRLIAIWSLTFSVFAFYDTLRFSCIRGPKFSFSFQLGPFRPKQAFFGQFSSKFCKKKK